MIYEIASLPVRANQVDAFTRAFNDVTHLLTRAQGYGRHMLTRGVETPSHFTLIVQWQTLEDHTQVFEPSEDHRAFMGGLERYFAEEPTVYHVRSAVAGGWLDVLPA